MSDSKKIVAQNGEIMLSARKAAKRLSCAPDYVGKLCREGKLEGERVDNAWFVRESSIVAFETARTEARTVRSQELALERQKEQDTYRKNNGLPLQRKETPAFLQKYTSNIFSSAAGRSAAFALGGAFLFASLVFAGQVATPQSGPFTFSAGAQEASALASVQSPFFSAPPLAPVFAANSSQGNFFSSVLAFLFGNHSSKIAEQTTPTPTPVAEQPVAPAQNTPSVVASVSPATLTPAGTIVENKTYPVIERTVVETHSGVTQASLDTQLQELSNSLRQVIFSSVNSDHGAVYSSGGVTNNVALSQIINSLSGVAISGGTITGARISGGSISGLSGLDLASGCFSVAGVCISSGGNAAGSTGAIQFNTGGAFDASSTQFVWDAVNNRLGIGTSTPMQALSLGAGGVISITSNDGSSNGCFKEVSGQLQYSNDCSTYQSFTAAAAGGWTDTGAIVHLTTGSANVGIGTSTPYAKLTVWGADTSASTNAFEIANAASTTLLSVNDAGQTTLLDLFATGSTTLQKVTATQATTSALFTSMLGIGVGNYFTSLLGTGLSNNAGVLTVSTTSLGLLGSTSLSASAPLSYNTNTGGFSISQSGLATNGYLSSGDFTTFNNKISSTSLSASGPLSYNSATGAFAISQAGVAQNGYISSGDFSTFNNKISSSSLSGSGVISYNSSTGSFNTTPGTFGGANAYTFPAGLIVAGNATTTNLAVTGSASSTNFTVSSLGGSGTSCVQADASGKLSSTGSACGSGSGAVNSVANSDGTLTISPTTGAVVASLNTAHTNIFTGLQQFSAGASTTQLSAGLAYFGATATSSFNGAGVLTLAGGLNGPLQANNGVVSATSSIGVLYGGTGTTTAPSYGQILVGNILGGYDLVGTSSLGIVSSGGLTFGKSWEITNGYLAPTTTLGIIVAASSTIGNGTQAGGLTINGGATTTGNALVQGTLQVLGTGTSTFTTNIGIAGNIIPATTNTYSLGSIANTWKDIYVGPGSLFVNGQEVLHTDGSNNVVVSSSINQNLVLQTTGTANIELNPSGTGQLLIKSGILLTGGKSFTTSDSSAVLFPSGVTGGNLTLSGNTITPTVLNSGISLTPNGSGGTYVTAGNFGIGTTTPATTLSVVGSGYITGGFGVGVLNTTPGTLVVAGNTTLANATTTNFAITNISSALLKATASGSVVPAVAGVDYAAAGASAFGKSWEITNGYLAPTTTLGIIVAASSTIGNGAQAGGLTIAGGATTTGSLQVNGGITVNGSLKLAGTTGSVQCLQVGSNGVITGTGSICGSGGGGSSTFLGLSDVPGAYIANQVYYTNSSATGVAGNNNFTFNDVTNTLTASNISTPTLTVSGSSSFGTVIAGIWHGTAIADAYVADNLTISAGTINNTPIGASVPSTGVFTNATTTNLAAYNLAQFGGTATSSFSSTGALTLATALTVPSGGTGSTTLGGLLTGNGTGAVISATVSAPLTFSGNTLAISQATLSQNGYLSSTDFTTFDNKISSTSLSGGTGISYAPATGVITNTGVTSNVAGTGISLSGATGAVTITNSGVTSLAGTANQITVSGSTGAVTLSLPSQLIIQNASTTNLSANTVAFGATGTTSIASNGTLTTPALTIATLSGLLKATAGVVSVASAGSDYENPLTFNYPLTRSTNAISLAFGTTTANTYSLLQTFNGGASTTNLTISNVPSSLLSTNVSGAAQATTVSLPLSFSGSTLSLSQSGTGANGYLSSTDFNTFNNKISSTSLSASAPLGYNSSTGAFSITQATTGTNGYLSSADFTTFNNKLSSTSLQTSALLAGLLSDETGSGSVVFSASPTFSGLAIFGSASTSQVSATTAYFGGTATSSFSSTGALTLATALTVQSGGTGSSTPLGGILAGNGASAVKSVVIGTGLTFDGTTLATNGGGITAIGPAGQTQTGGTQLLATSTTGTDFTITASTNTQTFNLPFASLTATGKLSSANFFTFNNKISSTSLSGQSVISYNSGGTGIITTTGGTFGAGDYIFPGNLTATAGLATFGNASTTNLSAYTAAFGGSATSSFSSTGALTLATALGIANGGTGAASFGQGWLFSNGGTGALAASTSPTVNYLFASSTTATSTFNGGFSAAGSLFVLQNGAVGIGNSTPGKTFDVTGTGRFSSTLTLSDAGTISCSGTKALQTDVQGNVVCSTVSMGSLSTAGGWTEDNAGTVSLTNISDSVAMGATSTPYAKLAILSGSAATTTLALVPASGQTANIIDIYNTSGALASVFTAAGRLGIGTTSPFATLSVAGNGFFNSDLTASNITATGTLVVGGTLSAGGTTLVTTAGGNVGIGTSSPTSLLSIVGGNITHTASGNPALATSVPALATAHSYKTYVSGNYAYEAEYEGGLRIFDVSNPKNPVSAGSYSTYAKVDDVIVAGKYAYLADAGSGIVILDVSNPSAPTFLSNYAISFSGYAIGIALSGKYLLATDINGNAVRVIDVSDPVHPALAGSYNGGGSSFPRTVAVSGKYAYVGDYNGSVYTLDISNPAVPAKVSTSYTTNVVGPSSLYVSGKYLYVADVGGKGMYVLNISNPASLSPAGTYNPGGTSSYEDVKVAGSYAYLADDAGNLAQVDIRNKAQISPVGSYALGGIGRGVALAGKYAYVSADTTGLQIIDINGLDTPAANIGSLAANILNVSDSLNVGGDIYAGGGLDVGVSGIFSRGGLSVFGSTTLGATLTVNGTSTLTGLATLTGGLLTNASSTLGNFTALFATTSQATTTNFAITSIGSGNLLKTTTGGAIIAAVAGTDYITGAGLSAAYPFQVAGNATSTLTQFNGGLTAYASSTIGDGTQAGGLTISGGATSTLGFNSLATNLLSYQGSTTISVAGTNNFFAGLGANGSTTKTTGANSVFIGNGAGYAVTSGWNTFIGSLAANGSTTGAAMTGPNNVGIGYASFQYSSAGGVNTGVGNYTLRNNAGTFNSAFGYGSLTSNTDGSHNSAVGYQALSANTTGSSNAGIGSNALSANKVGSQNVSVGVNSLLGSTGDSNTALGFRAGRNITTGHSNIMIGAYVGSAGASVTSSGNIGIGNETFFPSTNTDNQLNIGGLVFGTLPATSTAFQLPTTGALGVGTSSPFAKFAIQTNNGDTSKVLFAIGSSTQSATSTLFSISNTGSTTLYQLNSSLLKTDANGTIIAAVAGTDYVTGAGLSAAYPFTLTGNATSTLTQFNGGLTAFASSTIGDGTQAGGLTISGGSTTTLNAYFASNVGIGSTTPYSTLSVTGTTTSTGGFNVDSNANLLSYQGSTTISVMGTNNFFAGLQANGSTTKANGTDNIFIGNAAGYAVTSNQNVYIGSQSGIGSTTGAPNSGFGNTAVGYQTLQFNSTGSVNTANGYSALQNNTTGNGNSAFGYHALFYNTTGSSNTANGYQTLYWNTTGSSNTANGMSALYHNTTGSINTANGYQALYSNSTGSNNAANGYNALGSNTTGTNNTAMGYLAGYSVTTGYSNTFIGDYTTSNNTITTGGGNIGLGSNVFFPSATGNNQLNIGGILFGALPATTTAFKLPTSGSIGVGTSSPWAKFSIATNNGDTNTVLFAIGSSTQTATTTLFSVSNTGFTNVQANGTAGGFESKVVNPPDVLNTSGTLADTFVNTTIATDITQSQSNTSHGLTGLYTELSASQSLVATTSKWKAVEINSDTEHENITTYGAGLLLDSPFMQMSAPNILPNYVALDVNGNDTATRYGQPGDGMYVGLTSKITNLYGIRVGGAFIDGAAAVNNNYGINIGAPCTGSCDTGNIYNNYGLYIADQSTGNSGATSTYAIYSNGGKSYFDDSVGIGSTTPTAKLTVQNTFWDNSYYGNNSGLLFLVASSTAANGSTATNLFSISNTGSTTLYQLNSSLLKTDANGTIVAAVAGTDYITGAGLGSAYPFQVAGNATSTLTQFNGGLTAYASSTIGNGTQAGGLTINGGATTTGNAYFAGNVGIGSTSPAAVFSVLGRNGVPTNKNAPIAFYVQGGNGIGGGTNGGIGGDILFIAGNGSSGASGDSRAGNLTITAGNGSSGNGTGVGGNITINPGATGGGGAGNIILANLQGNVGIGTTSPFAKLSVQGNGYLSGNLTATNITATGTLAVSGLSTLSGGLTAYASSTIGNGTQTGGLTISGGATTTGNLVVQGIATANTFNASGASTTLISLNGQSLLAASSTNGSFFLGLGAGTTTLNSGIYANDNFGVGYQALQANTGANNFAVGYQAGFSNTTGGNNNFFGNQAGYFNTTGGSNNFLGNSAGWSNTTGFSNNFLGNYAGGGNTTGTDNNFLGNSAGGNNTTGTDNNFLGYQAGYFNTTGGNNNFIGHGAGASNTTGSGNIAIGTDALWSDVGAYNADTGIGFQVAYGGSGTFASSTFLGYQAGYNNVASQNTFIGALSGQNLTSGTNSIALGYNALFPSTTNNNQLNVGNLLFGTLPAASDTATAFKLPIAGALGVGTSSPYAKFAIQTNNGDTSKVLFAIGSSTASATTTLFSINNIGLISGLNLNLTGGATSTSFAITSIGSGNLLKTTTGGAIIAAVAGVDYLNTDTNWAMLNGALTPTTTTLGIGIFGSSTIGNGTQAGGLTISGGATTTGIAYFASNVGIGTTSPYSTLSVNGTTTSTGGFNVDSNTNLLSYQGSTTISVTGTNNFFAGLQANGSTTKANGTDNVFIGNAAGYAVTSNSNVYIGSFSGVGSTTGAPNSGAYNTAVGIATLKFNSTGGSNAAFGALALQKNTTGSRNNAFGASSLGKNTTGQDNNAFGVSALTNNTTGSNNTAYGAYALTGSALGTNTGSGNTAIGYYALAGGGFVTNDTGTNNTALGFQAGYSVSTGYSNTLVGDNSTANNTITTGSGNLGLGSNVFFPSATANSQLNIGNLIYGSLPATTTAFQLPTTGSLGIGSSTPWAKFSIATNNGDTNPMLFAIGSSTASATTTLFSINNTGLISGLNLNLTGGATSTSFAITGTASTTGLIVSSAGGTPGCATFSASGLISNTGTACGSASGAAPFTWTTNFGVIAAATTSPIWAQNGIFASSTSHFANLDYSGMLGFATSSANASSTIFTFNGRSFIIASTSNGYLSGGNTGVGLDALSNLTSGSINTALGYQALQLATSAAQNTAIGYQALQYLETGTDNTAVGYGALFTIYGSRNTVVGSGAANQGGAPGDDNIAVGYSTGPVNGGSQNIVIGNEAMWMAAGKNNVLLGYQNLTNAWRSAYNSTLIGNQAGYSLGYSNGDTTGSTFLGFQAGFNVDDGYGNLLIGASSTNDLISGSNNIAIGNNTHFQSDTNNQLNIGGILFGTVPATSTAFKLPTTGSLGVGTSSPWAKFSIATNNGDTNPILFAIGSSTASATTTLFSISNTGNSFLSGTASTTGLIVSSAGGTAGCATFSAAGLISNTGTACGSGGGGTYDFPLTGNATSTLTQFNGGLTAFASSTIGNGTQAGGLTISGGATSTLGFNIASSTLGLSLNGVAALQGSTTKNNYFFGGATLPTNLLGIYNYAIGQGALANATSSFIRHNFAVGYQAGQNATGGYYNNFIGEQAGQNNAGFNNNFLGYQVGTSNTTGSYNNFMAGGGSNTTGGYNNYLGSASGAQSTTGSNNNFFGSYAGFNNITGSNNNFIGNQVGYSNTTGYSNTFIGDSSVGYATGNITTGSGNIGLGSNVFFPSATGNRQLNIGNLIYGTLPATSTAFQLPTTGSLGIGSSTPWAKFSIATNNGDTNPILFAIGSSTQSATTTLFSISNTGTASTTGLIVSSAGGTPGCATFSAAGLISNTGTACGSGGSSAYDFPLTGNATSTLTQFNGGLTAYASSTIGNGTQAGGLTINGGATTTGNAYFPTQSSTITGNKILTLGSVNGTYGPTSLTLENESGANGPIFSTAGSSVNLIDFGFIPGSGAQQNIRLEARSTSTYGTGNSAGEFQIGTMGSTPNPNLIIGAGTTAVRNGNFGVGTTSPFANLSIQANNGSTNTMLFAIGSSTASNTSTLAYFDNNGSFFVGTSTNQGFHVINNAATAGNGLSITTTPAPVNVNSSGGGVTLSTVSNAGNENLTIQSKGVSSLVLSSPSGSIVLSANSAGMTVSQRQINMAPFAPNSSGFVFNYNSNSGPASLAASTEVPMVAFNTNITDSHNNGAIALQRNFLIKAASETFTTYSKSNSITNAATLGIDSAPMAGINGTTTNAYGILVGSSTPSVMFNASTTNSYGLGVFAGAGAQNNYAAIFNGGNVGVGTTTPFANFSLHANNGDTNTTLFAIGSSTQSATTTLFSISNTGTASTTGLIVSSAGGTPGCATFSASGLISNTGTACGSGGGGTYDFPLTGNATSTLTQFNGGLTAFASSTIGNGTQAGGLTINGGATTTGNAYFAGNVGIGTTNPGALLTVNGTASTTNVTISALGGQAGNCLGIDSSGVVIGQSCSGAAGASLTAANTWTQLQTFQLGINSQASSTIGNGTQAGGVTISGGATTTGFLVVQGNSTSTFAAGLQTSALNVTSATASSTFASGINISSGCFAIGGTCLSTGGGASLTGSVGQAAYFSGTNTAVGTSSLFISTASNVGIGTSTPYGKLTVWGADSAAGTLAFLVANSASTTAFSVDDAGNGFVSSKFSIGTTSTLSALVVSGSASVGADYNVAAPANGFIVEGNVGIGTTTPTRKLSVTDTVANPQVMVSYDQTRYSTMQVDASGNLTIHASNGGVTQGGITFSDDNVWVCQSGTCPVLTASSTSGNLFVENGVVLGDGFRLQEINTTDLGLYDTNGALMVTFDHGL